MLAGIIGLLFLGVIAYLVASTLAGSSSSSIDLDSFNPQFTARARRFEEPPPAVFEAYAAGIKKSPAMKISDRDANSFLVDAKPSMRILGGSFGMLIKISFVANGTGTLVNIDSSHKVSWAPSVWGGDALRNMERAFRMNAKKTGITEVLD